MSAAVIFDHGVVDSAKVNQNTRQNNIGFFILGICSLVFLLVFFGSLIYIFWRGMGEAFSWHYLFSPPKGGMHDTGGVLYPLIGTIQVVVSSILFASPIGIFAGIYLSEYSRSSSRLVRIARFSIQSLAGIPSVIFGLFGLAFFVLFLGFKHTLLAASLSVAMMILPFIITTTEEAFLSVPQSFREASLALGATKTETVFKIILPAAMPGILTGIVLGIGRAISESAILILAAGGSITALPRLFGFEYPFLLPDSGRTLAVHLYYQATSYNNTDKAFATAVILVILILVLNTIVSTVFKKRQLKSK